MTTTIARIVDQFTMHLDDPAPGHEEWFLDWVLRSPILAGKHLTAGWLAYGSLAGVYGTKEFSTAWEPFGGMGAQALMIDKLFRPAEHTVQDYSAEAVGHLRRNLPAHIVTRQADSYDMKSFEPADLVGADFGDLTVWRTRDKEKHRRLLDAIFATSPKAVVLTDIACRYLHLHCERYETLLGKGSCGSYESYLDAFLSRLRVLYGYRLVRGYWDRWSAVMALVPDDVVDVPGKLLPTPDVPLGIALL